MNENYIRERIFELIDASDISASHLCEELHLNKGYFADVRRENRVSLMIFWFVFAITLAYHFLPSLTVNIHSRIPTVRLISYVRKFRKIS